MMQFVNLGFHGRPRSLCSRLLPAHPASLSLGLQRLKVLIDVCRAEVVQNNGLLIEILAPDLGDFALSLGELLVVLAPFITRQLNLLSFNYEGTVKSIES